MNTPTTTPIAEMKILTRAQSTGDLIDAYQALTADGVSREHRLIVDVMLGELASRCPKLQAALDAWEYDLDSTETPVQIASRFIPVMDRNGQAVSR